MNYDVVVVGGGSAGGVLAARLSEDGRRRVLLLEAGPDSLVFQGPSMLWDLVSDRGFLPRGKLIGGCSAMNAAIALRGYPQDYDRWPEGWSWAEVLPFFRKLETDADFGADPWHGDAGPVAVRRAAEPELTELSRAFVHTAVAMGHKHVEDHNRPGAVGVGAAPMNAIDDVQQSTARTYLAAARDRANLTVRCGALVDRVIVAGGRAVAVKLAEPDEIIETGAVVVAAGAYGSPAILLRSGVGPADELRALGVDVVADVPGVGRNLQDHPLARFMLTPIAGLMRPRFESILSFADGLLQGFVGGPPPGAAGPGDGTLLVGAALMRPKSRGRVWLRSPDPRLAPNIDLGLLTDPADLPPLREAALEMARIVRAGPLVSLLDGPGPSAVDDEWLRANVGTYHHPTGTCAMGQVVDARCALRGVDGVWVADASVMPEVPAANTNLPTMMLAERVAPWLAEAIG